MILSLTLVNELLQEAFISKQNFLHQEFVLQLYVLLM
jgi:hypothetical protein